MEQISQISDIIMDAILTKNSYSKSIKMATAFGFWSDICGSRFSKFSQCYDIKGNTLFVAVKNPQVMQELIFCKDKLLSKINDYFLPLDIKIEEIRYNYKVWNNLSQPSYIRGDESLSYYSEKEINDVPLNRVEQEELNKVTNTISNLNFLDDKLKEKYQKSILNSVKAKKLREQEEV